MDTGAIPVDRGQTYYNGNAIDVSSGYANVDGVHLEGSMRIFTASDPSNRMVRRNGGDVRAVLVRNRSGQTLLPKRAVVWAAGYRGKGVAGYARSDAEEVAGVVDEFLPAGGVPDGDLFWLVVQGPTLVKSAIANYSADIAEGDWLAALTATTSALTGGHTGGGRMGPAKNTFTAAETTDGTGIRHTRNVFGRAASACVTNNTNADVLVDMRLY